MYIGTRFAIKSLKLNNSMYKCTISILTQMRLWYDNKCYQMPLIWNPNIMFNSLIYNNNLLINIY